MLNKIHVHKIKIYTALVQATACVTHVKQSCLLHKTYNDSLNPHPSP